MGGEGVGPLGIMTESCVWRTESNACGPRVAGVAAGTQEAEHESSAGGGRRMNRRTDGRIDGRPGMSRDLMIVGRPGYSSAFPSRVDRFFFPGC